MTPRQRAQLEQVKSAADAAAEARSRRARSTSTAASTPPAVPGKPSRRRPAVAASTEPPAPAKPKRKLRKAARPLTAREMVDRVVEIVEKRDQPRSTVGIELGPRGQAQPRVTIVTGEDPARVDVAVQKACSVIDYLVERYQIQLSSGRPAGGE